VSAASAGLQLCSVLYTHLDTAVMSYHAPLQQLLLSAAEVCLCCSVQFFAARALAAQRALHTLTVTGVSLQSGESLKTGGGLCFTEA
jgi:hypothetical protein